MVFREVNEEETDYRNGYSHYRDITVTVASLSYYIHKENCSIFARFSSLLEIRLNQPVTLPKNPFQITFLPL